MLRYLLLALAWACVAIGALGVIVPVLPTTPLLLLATFLFAKTSPRLHAWIRQTKLYNSYVVPFKEDGGLSAGKKARILCVSLGVLVVSAMLAPRPVVWAILSCVAAFLLYLILVRIPTTRKE